MRALGNALLDYRKPDAPLTINLLSLQSGAGKSFVAEHLTEYFRKAGLNIGQDVILHEYPSLDEASVPSDRLRNVSVNLLVARADRAWKDTDQLLFDRLKERAGDTPLFLCLTKANLKVVENFTGMLPPYTFLRKLGARFYQLGLTSTEQ